MPKLLDFETICRLIFDIDFHSFMGATNITQMYLIIIEAY